MTDQLRASPIGAVPGLGSPGASNAPETASAARPTPPPPPPHAQPKPTAEPQPEVLRNVRLKFKVDPQTNDITVLMIDVASRRVIRAIPPEELQKLDEGELVELLA
jgi:hypothetical protein